MRAFVLIFFKESYICCYNYEK